MRILLLNPNTLADITDLVAREARALAGDVEFVPATAAFGPRDIGSRAGAAITGLAARLAPFVRVPLVDSLAAAVGQAIALVRAGGGAGAAETGPPPVDSVGLSAPLTRLVSGGRP